MSFVCISTKDRLCPDLFHTYTFVFGSDVCDLARLRPRRRTDPVQVHHRIQLELENVESISEDCQFSLCRYGMGSALPTYIGTQQGSKADALFYVIERLV